MRRFVIAMVCGVLGALAVVSTASAHADLMSSDPAANTVLSASPPSITLTFTEAVNIIDGSLRVIAPDGTDVVTGTVGQDAGSASITASLPTLGDGTYIVAWKAISDDSHPVQGAFSFSVGAPSANAAGDAADVGDATNRSASIAIGIGRALSFGGVGVVTGAMCILVWLGGIERRRSAALLWVALGAAIVGTLLMIAGQAANIGGWWQWLDVVRTDSGRWWAARLVALVASIPLVLGRNSSRAARIAIGAWTVALAVIVAGGGHARAGHLAGLAFPATVVHLIAMALWVGGIAVLLIAPRDDRGAMAVRFSPVALVSVAALAVTGTFNAWRQSSSLDALLASRYGDALLVKLSVIAAIIAIAATTRSLTRSGQHRTLPRTLSAEMLGFVLVFAATAVLTASAPPRDIVSANAPVVITEGTRTLTLTLDPSGTPLSLVIQTPEQPDEAPTTIVVSGSLPGAGLGPIDLPGRMIANGVWVSDDNPLPTPGRWTIQVVATYGEFDATTFTGQVEMPAPAPSA